MNLDQVLEIINNILFSSKIENIEKIKIKRLRNRIDTSHTVANLFLNLIYHGMIAYFLHIYIANIFCIISY